MLLPPNAVLPRQICPMIVQQKTEDSLLSNPMAKSLADASSFFTLHPLNRLSPQASPEQSEGNLFDSPRVMPSSVPHSVKQEAKRFCDSERPPAFSGMRTDEGEDGGPRDHESTPDKLASCKKRLNFAGVKVASATSDEVFLSSDRDDDLEEMKDDSSYECLARRPPARYATSKR